MSTTNSKLFKQRLQRIHTSAGIVFSLLMYIAVFFGIFAILLPYIQVWEKPSRHFKEANITQINYSAMIDPIISNPDFPKNNIIITLPGYKGDPALKISHQFMEATVFNPRTQKILKHEGDQSQLAKFLNGMHYGRPLDEVGYTIFGLMAVGVMFSIIGGLLLVYVFKYSNKGKNQQANFSKWHRKILTWVFPPFIIITLTGALMCVGYNGSGPMTYIASKGESFLIGTITNPILFPENKTIKKQHNTVPMLPISQLIKKAQSINPEINLQKLTLINWKDSSARIKLQGYNPYKPFLNGIFNKPTLTLSAVDGSIIQNIKVMDRHWSVLVSDASYFLHLLFGVDIFTRLFIALMMLAACFALGFGVMLWLEKKARKFNEKITFYHWMGKLSLALMIGVIPSVGLLFVFQWLLPFDLKDRVLWQQALFFDFWLFTLFWSFFRINSYTAAKEFLSLGGMLFMFSSILHFIISGFTPLKLLQEGMQTILLVDIALITTGLVLLFVSYKLPKNRNEAKLFWNKQEKRSSNE